MNGRSYVPHCVACNRPDGEPPIMLSVQQGGMPTYLCSDCLAELHQTAQSVLRQRDMDRAAD